MKASLNKILASSHLLNLLVEFSIFTFRLLLPILTRGRKLGLQALDLRFKRQKIVVNFAPQAPINVLRRVNVVNELCADALDAL